jgi:amidase
MDLTLSDLPLAPAVDQVAAVKNGVVSAADLLEATLARYERFNPDLNAIVVTSLDEARARAAELDAAAAAGQPLGPLHGLPMTIKEAFNWAGKPTTWGYPAMADNIADDNATMVQRLHDAGAVIYGKTNVPISLGDWQSFNEIYGTTNNPWDLSRSPGGSSGGSAAALAAGMAGLELGSDIGASIRNPAHYCGVFGHKPTFDLLPMTGHSLPGSHPLIDIGVVGPLARSAADLDLALDVLAGPDRFNAVGYRIDLPSEPRTELSQFKVGVMLESPVLTQDDELTAQLTASVAALEQAGLQVHWDAKPDIDQIAAHENYLVLLRAALAAFVEEDDLGPHEAAAERYRAGDRDYRAIAGRGITISHRHWWHASNERENLRGKWAEFFNDYDLLLCPIAASAAIMHDHVGERPERTIAVNGGRQPGIDQMFWAGWSCNVYLPATMAPVGVTASGLPVGLQIVAPHLHDRRSIAFAGLIERELGGFVPPPGYEALPAR